MTTDELLDATSDGAWVQAMLDAEAALALAEADVGVIPSAAAEAIASACDASRFDPAALGRSARDGGNPVIPLVRALAGQVHGEDRSWVHWGATSQDILDTAAMLVARRSLDLIDGHVVGLADACAALAARHRGTVMVGRTLLQPALPITFGLKAAGWLAGCLDAGRCLAAARERLAIQLGGAAGTLASLGADGPAVAAAYAARLGLAEPPLPWHTARQRVAELAGALGIVAGTAAKVAMDVALLMQAEVGEAAEPARRGRGGSSTMPQKRNPVGAAAAVAAARRAHALVPVILGALVAEHERALGGWQAEWEPLAELLALAGGAVARTQETVAGLEIHADAMAANLSRSGGVLMAERVALALAPVAGRVAAAEAVGELARRALATGADFATLLAADPLGGSLGARRITELLDPAGYVGATDAWIDRALALHQGAR